jgi:hypothetical protein
MGVFYTMVDLFNRAPENLTVQFDGQCKTLTPGHNIVPSIVVQHAKNQNPIMGTGNPSDPTIAGCQYLVGVAEQGDDVEPLTPAEWNEHLGRPSRTDEQEAFREEYGSDPKARLVIMGKGRKSTAKSRYEAGASASLSGREATFDHDK